MAKKCYIENVINPVLESGTHWESQEFKKGTHNGEDLINRTKTTSAKSCYIIAIECGTVTQATYSSSRGYYVEIKHDNGKYSRYLHMAKGTFKVKKNQLVKKGDLLGYMGNTGNSQGLHLHLAIFSKVNGVETFEDPYDYLVGNKSFNNEWEKGTYRLLKDKYVRTSPEVANNKVKYNSLMKSIKENCVKDSFGYAKWKTGKTIDLSDFVYDKKGNLWGKRVGLNTDLWICVNDSSGNQVIRSK